MKTTRINMKQHTVSVKMTRYELAEVKYALAKLSEYYRDRKLDNLAGDAWSMNDNLQHAFDRLFSDVE